MFYHKYSCCEALQPYVECYFLWESEKALETPLVVESPPNGFCSMVFNYGDPYTLKNSKHEKLQVPRQFVSGQSIYSYSLTLVGRIGICGIVFKPAALATLYHLPMYELVEERMPLSRFMPEEKTDRLMQEILAADEPGKIKLLEKMLLDDLKRLQPQPDFIDQAANFIVAQQGMLQVAGLVKESHMSRRTFERRFFEKVGLSPKYFARIRRISHICSLIAGKKKVDWPQVFYECDFYDQAHFIKDFEAFTGRSPQQYLKENAELANFLSAERPDAKLQ